MVDFCGVEKTKVISRLENCTFSWLHHYISDLHRYFKIPKQILLDPCHLLAFQFPRIISLIIKLKLRIWSSHYYWSESLTLYHMNKQQGVGNHMAYSQFIERPYIWHGSSNFTSRPAMFLTNFFFLKVTGTNLSLPKQASRRHNFKTVFNGSDTIRVLVTYRRPKGKLMDTDTM